MFGNEAKGIEQPKINLKNTTQIFSEGGNILFGEGVILRKISRFAVGSDQDVIVPIPVFYDLKTKEILVEMAPKEIQDELREYNESVK